MLDLIFTNIILYVGCLLFATFAKVNALTYKKSIWRNPYIYIVMLIYVVIVGCRYDVGLDYFPYCDLILNGDTHYGFDRIEYIPQKIIQIVGVLGARDYYYVWFMIMAAVQIAAIISFSNKYKELLVWILFYYLSYELGSSVNIVRHSCALVFILYSAYYINKKDVIKYVLCILLAIGFHKSSVIFLPMYWLVNFIPVNQRKIQYLLFVLMNVGGLFIVKYILSKGISLFYDYGYSTYASTIGYDGSINEDIAKSSGLGVIFKYIRWSIYIWFSSELIKQYKNIGFIVYYRIFFIGICFFNAMKDVIILSRLNSFFMVFDLVVSAFFINYLLYKKGILKIVLCFVFLFVQLVIDIFSFLSYEKWDWVWNH